MRKHHKKLYYMAKKVVVIKPKSPKPEDYPAPIIREPGKPTKIDPGVM